jgi:membrane protease YdiL (CAAX protease family)
VTGWPTTLGGLVLAFGALGLLRVASSYTPDRLTLSVPGSWSRRAILDATKWAVAGLLLAYISFIEGESLSSVGAEPISVLPFVGWVVGGLVGTVALTSVVYAVYERFGLTYPREFVEEQAARSTPASLFTAVTAGVTESLLYQGYPIERLRALTGSLLVAAVASWVVFTAVHYIGPKFSLQETVYIGAPALAMTVLYALSGNLLVIIVVHSAVNVLSFLSGSGARGPDDSSAGGSTT